MYVKDRRLCGKASWRVCYRHGISGQTHTYVRTYTHTLQSYITYMHACMHTSIHTLVHTYVHTTRVMCDIVAAELRTYVAKLIASLD